MLFMQPVSPRTDSLQALIVNIEQSALALPDFQRKYEWKLEAVKRLLDSILHGFPAGSLLFMTNKLDQDTGKTIFSLKNVEGSPSIEDPASVKTLILDGQQRLTSLYQVLYNKNKKGLFYLNLEKFYKEYKTVGGNLSDIDFTEYIEVFKNNSRAPDVNSIDTYLPFSMLQRSKKKDSYNAQRNAYRDRLIQRGAPQDYIDFIGNDLDEITRPVFEYEFPVLDISEDLDMPGVCRVFETLNSTGKNLSSFDICVAKFYADEINIRKGLEDAMEVRDENLELRFPYLHILFGEEKYHVYPLQVIALVSGKKHSQNSLSTELDAPMIKNLWNSSMYSINETLRMMDDFGACTSTTLSLIPYAPTIVIIATALIKSNYQNMNAASQAKVRKKVRKFFFQTALMLKYGDAAMSQTKEDSESLAKWLMDDSKEPDFMKSEAPWYLQDMLKINGYRDNGARARMIRCLMNIQNPRDFKTEDMVMTLDTRTDLHHIFPEDRYKGVSKKGYSINSVFNLTYISSPTNKSIGKERTYDYIDAITRTSYEGSEDGFRRVLRNHFIADDDTFNAFKNECYDDFLESRAKEMVKYLKELNINVCLFDSADSESDALILIEDDQ